MKGEIIFSDDVIGIVGAVCEFVFVGGFAPVEMCD